MTVVVDGAEHVAEHAGECFFFCGPGCRQHYSADPAAVLAGGAHRH
jgi:YHS domain-containing protein